MSATREEIGEADRALHAAVIEKAPIKMGIPEMARLLASLKLEVEEKKEWLRISHEQYLLYILILETFNELQTEKFSSLSPQNKADNKQLFYSRILNWAIGEGHAEVVNMVLDQLPNPHHSQLCINTGIEVATTRGHTALFKTLINDPRINVLDFLPNWKDRSINQYSLILQSTRVNADILCKLFDRAAHSNNIEAIKMLLQDPRFDPTYKDFFYDLYNPQFFLLLLNDPRFNIEDSEFNLFLLETGVNFQLYLQDLITHPIFAFRWYIFKNQESDDENFKILLEKSSMFSLFECSKGLALLSLYSTKFEIICQYLSKKFDVVITLKEDNREVLFASTVNGIREPKEKDLAQRERSTSHLYDKSSKNSLVKTLLMNCIEHAKKDSWTKLVDKHISARGTELTSDKTLISDTITDYAKSILAPTILKCIEQLGEAHPLYYYLSIVGLAGRQPHLEIFQAIICQKTMEILFSDKDIAQITELSAEWHKPRQQIAFNKQKDYSTNTWPPLFQTNEDMENANVHDEINIPTDVMSEADWKFVARISSQALKQEGEKLSHCVGGYTSRCLFENSHIVSIVNPLGEPVSTIEFKTNYAENKIVTHQHFGKHNAPPTQEAIKAYHWLNRSIANGSVLIDYHHLESQKQSRVNPTFSDTAIKFVGFNALSSKKNKSVRHCYRQHTPNDFKPNLEELIHLDRITLPIDDAGNTMDLELGEKSTLKAERRALAAWEQNRSTSSQGIFAKASDIKLQEKIQQQIDEVFPGGKVVAMIVSVQGKDRVKFTGQADHLQELHDQLKDMFPKSVNHFLIDKDEASICLMDSSPKNINRILNDYHYMHMHQRVDARTFIL